MLANTTIEKILGSVLLLAGLAIIGASLYLGINIFIKAQNPPEIFKPVIVATDAPITSTQTPAPALPQNLSQLTPADIQKLVNGGNSANMISSELIKSIIPPEMFNYTSKFMNLSVFSIFLWVLIIAGTKISSLGIALIKSNADVKF